MGRQPRQNYDNAVTKYRNGASIQSIANECGITREGMIYVLSRYGIKDRRDHDMRIKVKDRADEVVALYEQGMTMKNISKKFNCSEVLICLTLKRLGVKARKKKCPPSDIFPNVKELGISGIISPEINLAFQDFQKDHAKEVLVEKESSIYDDYSDMDETGNDDIAGLFKVLDDEDDELDY
jgi:orotate phosphoribosyltransferase-like protein